MPRDCPWCHTWGVVSRDRPHAAARTGVFGDREGVLGTLEAGRGDRAGHNADADLSPGLGCQPPSVLGSHLQLHQPVGLARQGSLQRKGACREKARLVGVWEPGAGTSTQREGEQPPPG